MTLNRYVPVVRSYIGSTVEPDSHLGRFGYPIACIFDVVSSFGCIGTDPKTHFRGYGRILTNLGPAFSDPVAEVTAWDARSRTAVGPREVGAAVDKRRDADDETVVWR